MKTNREGTELRICTACRIPHYENCRTCMGWGFRHVSATDSRWVIVSAAEAHDGKACHVNAGAFDGNTEDIVGATACSECGSTLKGTPFNG